MANGIRFSGMTEQDSIDDSAIIPITNKDGKTRTVTFKTLRDAIQSSILVGNVDSAGIQQVGALGITNNAQFNIASLLDGEISLDFSQIPPVGGLENRVRVSQASDLAGELDPTKEYFIDGVVDMGVQQIEVPPGGLSLTGYNFDASKLTSSADNYTMFVSPVSGSGNIIGKDYAIEVTGVDSRVYDIVSATGFDALEFARVNYNDCSSLGVVDSYRQGLEVGTGRFGGKPELILEGAWAGGFFIETSIVRNLEDGDYSLFKAGTGFSMGSRFRSNINLDLPASASFLDFSPVNLLNPSTLQIEGAIVTRNGLFNSSDANITPNISASNLASRWRGNTGMGNTFEGGLMGISSETETTIDTAGAFVDIQAAVWTTADLQHFDSPAGGQLRHLGNTPREYKVVADLVVDSSANNELTVRVLRWDNLSSSFIVVLDQTRQVNSFQGGRDVAFFNINISATLDENDYIKLQIANQSGTANITAENDSYFLVEQR